MIVETDDPARGRIDETMVSGHQHPAVAAAHVAQEVAETGHRKRQRRCACRLSVP
jgi:hypothetical protein